jgi:hypothetical protein
MPVEKADRAFGVAVERACQMRSWSLPMSAISALLALVGRR